MKSNKSLKEHFYQSFDPSRISTFLDQVSVLSEHQRRNHPSFQGEGTHFQSFALLSTPLSLAINIAKESFLKQSPKELDRWVLAIRSLKHAENQTLIPPLEIIQMCGSTAIIMPKGTPLLRKGAVARETADVLLETSRSLGKIGLVLDDYPQLVECQGSIFINDWSDLHRIHL